MAELPTEEELAKLPHRAIVAYAVRCARRAQPLYRLADDHPEFRKHLVAVEHALVLAEHFADGAFVIDNDEILIFRESALGIFKEDVDTVAATAAADNDGAFIAANAAEATWTAVTAPDRAAAIVAHASFVPSGVPAAWIDYRRLVEIAIGKPGEPGQPIDATERGPLGPLWPDGAPDWFVEGREWQRELLEKTESIPSEQDELPDADTPKDSSPIAGPLTVYIDSDAYTPEEKGELLSLISDLYELETGDRLVIDSMGTTQYSEAPVPAGSPDERM